jgi:hypothetical protein
MSPIRRSAEIRSGEDTNARTIIRDKNPIHFKETQRKETKEIEREERERERERARTGKQLDVLFYMENYTHEYGMATEKNQGAPKHQRPFTACVCACSNDMRAMIC